MAERSQGFCILNIRCHAFTLWERLRRQLPDADRAAVFPLSSAMCVQPRFVNFRLARLMGRDVLLVPSHL